MKKLKNGFLILLNMLGVVIIVILGAYLLYGIESVYDFIGSKIPFLGELFGWAETTVYD